MNRLRMKNISMNHWKMYDPFFFLNVCKNYRFRICDLQRHNRVIRNELLDL